MTRSRDAQRRPVHLEAEVFDLMTKWIERYRARAEERYSRLDEVLRSMDDAPREGAGGNPPRPRKRRQRMTTHDRETQISADPDVPLVTIVREFDAPVDRVFRAHADPELLSQWLGPRRLVMTVDHHDCRTGGSYRYTHVDTDGTRYGFYGSFHEVRAPELIVQTFTFEGSPDGVALERLVLEEVAGGRTRLTATSLVDSFAARDTVLVSGMEEGILEGYERLDELLAG